MVKRGVFLTDEMRRRLEQFPVDADLGLAASHFTLDDVSQQLLQRRSTPANKLAGCLQIGCLRMLGFIPTDLGAIPDELVAFAGEQLGIAPAALSSYSTRRQTQHQHARQVEAALGFVRCGKKELKTLSDWLVEQALEHDRPIVLYRLGCEFLASEKLVRPAATTIERSVVTARRLANDETYFRLMPHLDTVRRRELDEVCRVDHELGVSPLVWFRREASKSTGAAIAAQVAKIRALKDLGIETAVVEHLNPNRVRHLALIGKRLKPQAVMAMQPNRRYPILVCTLVQLLSDRTDEVLDLFDMTLSKFENEATAVHDERLKQRGSAAAEAFRVVVQTHKMVNDSSIPDAAVRSAILKAVGSDRFDRVAGIAAEHTQHAGIVPQDLIVDKQRRVRSFVPQMLEAVEFRATEQRCQRLLNELKQIYQIQKRTLANGELVNGFPVRWQRLIDTASGSSKRQAWEMAVLFELRGALRASDLSVEHSHRYQNTSKYLLPDRDWIQVREETAKLTKVDLDPNKQLASLATELDRNLKRLDQVANTDTFVRIDSEGLVNPPLDALPEDPELEAVHDTLRSKLPLVSIVELLVEVDSWCGFLDDFRHADNAKPRSENQQAKLLATIIAIACNIGTARVARFAEFTPEQLEWTATWYLRPDTVHKASSRIIRYQHDLPMAQHWGTGSLSSSDGQRFPVRVKTPRARHMSKYFTGTGATIYTWTSDRHTQYGTSFIPTTLREATYVLDSIFDNEHGLNIEEHTTDTAGYTDLVFGLFNLCGVTFSPRLKDIGTQRLWRFPNTDTNGLSASQLRHTINPQLIIDEWDNINKIAATIRHGHIPASTLITRLQASARRNRITRAVQEYGRIPKTNSILRYLHDQDHRRGIRTQLNKGESIHALRQEILHANRGTIVLEDTEAQDTQAELVTMIVNAINVWNTVYLTTASKQTETEDHPIDPKHLRRITPIAWEHINFQGTYNFTNPDIPATGHQRPLRQQN